MSLGKFNMLIGYFTCFCEMPVEISAYFQTDCLPLFFFILVVIYSGFKPSVSDIYYTFLLSFYCLSFHSLNNVLWWISSVSSVTHSAMSDPLWPHGFWQPGFPVLMNRSSNTNLSQIFHFFNFPKFPTFKFIFKCICHGFDVFLHQNHEMFCIIL